jgi:ornithine decarboxylase
VIHHHPTPFLVLDLDVAARAYEDVRRALPGIDVHYAVKCNPEPALLARLHALGCGFEFASLAELELLRSLGVDPAALLSSNPVRPPSHVAGSHAAGVQRFAVDSAGELRKLAEHAPGAQVYVRLAVEDPTSRLPLAGKFGVDTATAIELLIGAAGLGLVPHGLTFHVGSQALDPSAYARGVARAGQVMWSLLEHGIRLDLLDVGGGLPARYDEDVPPLSEYGDAILGAARRDLPYDVSLVVEPGRAIAAEAGVLVTSVIGVAERAGRRWVHLDVGAFNGLMESLETDRRLRYPIRTIGRRRSLVRCSVTGPTCDSEDTVLHDTLLPDDLDVGERLHVCTAGAYTTAYASRFNGFEIPPTLLLGRPALRAVATR